MPLVCGLRDFRRLGCLARSLGLRAEELLSAVGRLLNLTWQTIEVRPPAPREEPVRTSGLVIDRARAYELYDLAMKGDVRELLARAEDASANDPAAAPVCPWLRVPVGKGA